MTRRSPERQKPFYSLNNNVKQQTNGEPLCRSECTLRERFRPGKKRQPRRMPLRKVTATPRNTDAADRSALPRQDTLDQILTSCNARAMRYYRIWIYTCNAVLFISVMAFCAVAGRVFVGDYRRYLIPNLTLYQPSFLYAYLALFTQSGVLQVIGCIGALRLSERLLNVYWLMLLILLFGDVVIGIFWMFRFDKICQELKPNLRFRLHTEYGYNSEMTALWDRLQLEFACCGVQNAMDYGHLNRTGAQMLAWMPESAGSISDSTSSSVYVVPVSCCTVITEERTLGSNATEPTAKEHIHRNVCQEVNMAGCEERLQLYLRQSADVLFILGYCVIAFLKLCFLGILRYEIREMIQKIKILQAEMEARPSVISLDNNSSQNLGLSSPSHTILINTASANGSVPGGAGCDSTRTSTLHKPSYESTESERESLLVKESLDQPPSPPPIPPHPASATRAFLSAENLEYHQRNLQETCRAKLFPGDAAADSDTNSHCALLVEEPTSSPTSQNLLKNPNGNNNYELHEFREHISGASSAIRAASGGRLSTPETSVSQNI